MKLELRDVSCGYDKAKPVIKDINLTLKDGDVCCILGPNGVGKTTLFKSILNLIPPLSGQICIDGKSVSSLSRRNLSDQMAYVAQAHIPAFPYQVREIVMMGRMGKLHLAGQPTRRDYEVCEQALEDVGIRHLRDKVYTEISGGERQLLMIARALAQSPRILVMDEPTANLDYGNMVIVIECIRILAEKGLCIIFTSHTPDHAFMTKAKTALLFRNEPMVFGTCDEVVTNRNLQNAYKTDIQVLEIMTPDGETTKVIHPRFHR